MNYNKEKIRNDAIDYIYGAGMNDEENKQFADAVINEIDRMINEYILDKEQNEIPAEDFNSIVSAAFAIADEDRWDDYIREDSQYYHGRTSLKEHGINVKKKYKKTVKHYKTLNNAFLRNGNTKIYSSEICAAETGFYWYNSMYFQNYKRSAPCTLIYNEFHGTWEIHQSGRTL